MIKIYKNDSLSVEEIMARDTSKVDVSKIVSDIIENVRQNGDKALFEYCEKFDGGAPDSLLVSKEEIDDAQYIIYIILIIRYNMLTFFSYYAIIT